MTTAPKSVRCVRPSCNEPATAGLCTRHRDEKRNAERAAQGFGPYVTDPQVIAEIQRIAARTPRKR